MMWSNCLQILGGLALLIVGADKFSESAIGIARYFRLSPLMVGLLIVGLVTSFPEIIVGSIAALAENTEVAIGNAIGSNITNISLVFGVSLLFLHKTRLSLAFKHEFIAMCIALLIAFFLMLDGAVSRMDGLYLIFTLIVLLSYLFYFTKIKTIPETNAPSIQGGPSNIGYRVVLFFCLGLVMIIAGAEYLVSGSVALARAFGVSDLVIGLTIIAIGTSLPELSAAIASTVKGAPEIAFGNIIGSNMFNMLIVLGIPCFISPTRFPSLVLFRDFPLLFGLTIFMAGIMFIPKSSFKGIGVLLILCFICYQYALFTYY